MEDNRLNTFVSRSNWDCNWVFVGIGVGVGVGVAVGVGVGVGAEFGNSELLA